MIHTVKAGLLLSLFLILKISSFGQGRIVVNEFMAWSGCNTTSEFIELMNFGPGPMNIGCYIVTNGQYSVTIPPNTIVQPGDYYVISGQNTIAKDCGNRDSVITVDLNWTTCNCANTTIPTTGDGFMQDGGSANEKVILLDPSLNVIDAVSRLSTPSSSISITTSTLGAACSSYTFDLDLMGIAYETIGESTGIDNSYSRKVDGDCGWVKTTQISAGAPNKTNSTSSATYSFNTIGTSECNDYTGSISITVGSSSGSVSSYFPMEYTLAHDLDSNWIYTSADSYSYGVDNTSPNIDINNLSYGLYRITVASALGCNLKSFDFFIFNCYTRLLPLKLISFKYTGIKQGQQYFECAVTGEENLKKIVLEGAANDIYQPVPFTIESEENGKFIISVPLSSFTHFRLRLIDKKDGVAYSRIIFVRTQGEFTINRLFPNPANNHLNIELNSEMASTAVAKFYNLKGAIVKEEKLFLRKGFNSLSFYSADLPSGVYQLSIPQANQKQPLSFRFVKQ
jgi:hypothetical protein